MVSGIIERVIPQFFIGVRKNDSRKVSLLQFAHTCVIACQEIRMKLSTFYCFFISMEIKLFAILNDVPKFMGTDRGHGGVWIFNSV